MYTFYVHCRDVHCFWQENERLQERLNEETTLCQEYATEMADWVEMTNSLGSEVQRLREENEQLQLQLQLKHTQQHSYGHLSPT